MIAIITEKFSIGMDMARIVGATEKQDGYMSGNGYLVTWTLGHPVSLALPGFYGFTKPAVENLPLIPNPFRLTIRQMKMPKGTINDRAATKQLEIIDRVFSQCESIIVATGANYQGELTFRYIYDYLGYTKPFKRLWISSLTDEAIQKGLANLKEGKEYENLYQAADCRAKTDWLIGNNASRALAITSGIENCTLGRVQTPALAMICSRFRENRNFVSSVYWQLHVTLEKDGMYRKFRHTEDLKNKEGAEKLFAYVKTFPQAVITKVERKNTFQSQPLLYDLTALQKDCNVHLDLSAEKTLEIAQTLYEKKLISFPGTASRYIPEDVFREIPSLLRMILRMDRFKHLAETIDTLRPEKKSVNNQKATDHFALIITGDYARDLTALEENVYHMIAGRMLEAFSPRCEKESLVMEASVGDLVFHSHSQTILSSGWRSIFDRPEDKEEDENVQEESGAEFEEGDHPKVGGQSLAGKKTMPQPLYTESTLLAAIETAGKNQTGEASREAAKAQGLGTPATRAAIISTLFKREYVERSGKALIPTEKGLYIYDVVKDMQIADVEMTASWEEMLSDIEKRKVAPATFMSAIEIYTRQVTEEVLSIKFPKTQTATLTCPKCGTGNIIMRFKLAKCDNDDCGLLVFRKFLNKELTDQHLQQLFSSGSTRLIKGFKGKKGNSFDAKLVFDSKYNLKFSFPKSRGRGEKKTGTKPRTGSKPGKKK